MKKKIHEVVLPETPTLSYSRNYRHFIELICSLLYPWPDESIPHPFTYFLTNITILYPHLCLAFQEIGTEKSQQKAKIEKKGNYLKLCNKSLEEPDMIRVTKKKKS